MREKIALLALVNINELAENLVTEVRQSFEIFLPSWLFVDPAPLLQISILVCVLLWVLLQLYCVCWQKAHLGLLSGMSRHLNNVLDLSKKKANHSEIINLTVHFKASPANGQSSFLIMYILSSLTKWNPTFINIWVQVQNLNYLYQYSYIHYMYKIIVAHVQFNLGTSHLNIFDIIFTS